MNNLVCNGDSITAGYGIPTPFSFSLNLGPTWTISNVAIAGETLATMLADASSAVDSLYVPGELNVTTIWGGTNDFEAGADVTTVYNTLVEYCQQRRAVGWKVIVIPMIDRDSGVDLEGQKNAYNALIQATWPTFADSLCNMPPILRADGACTNSTYFQSDQTHPTELAATDVIAPIVSANVSDIRGNVMSVIAFDTFQRADENPLSDGGNWSVVPGGNANCQIVSDVCVPSVVGNPSSRNYWSGATWPDDQYSEVTLSAEATGSNFGLSVRSSASALTQYAFQTNGSAGLGSPNTGVVFVWTNGNPVQLGGNITFTPNEGDVIRLAVVGTTLTVSQNGTVIFTETDTSITSGSPGISMFTGGSVTDVAFSSWAGGGALPPDPESVSPTTGAVGAIIPNFTVNGADFDANGNATLSFSGTGITVNSYSVRSSTQIVANITISGAAVLGARDVIVTNASDGQSGTLLGALTVASSGPPNWSPVDSRNYGNFPNDFRVVQGSEIYDVPSVDSRAVGAPVDSRADGEPEDSRVAPNIPENSRNPPPF